VQGFGEVSDQAGFQSGKGETITQGELIDANLVNDAQAGQKVARIASGRKASFAGGGSFAGDKAGATGIGGSST